MNVDSSTALSGASLTALKRDAATSPQDEATLRRVAQQFEALLTQQILKSARATSMGGDMLGGAGLDLYKDLFDQQMAQQISAKGLGLADVLVQQLKGVRAAASPLAPGIDAHRLLTGSAAQAVATSEPAQAVASNAQSSSAAPFTDRVANFVNTIWQQAEQAAKALGLPTEAVVGHAALETGWGAHQPGGDSNNLFGIKTGSRWQGGKVTASTTEMDGGQSRTEQAEFRAYDTPEQGMADYVRFLKGNPRYAEAIKAGSTPQQFAEGLQKAGYATDPDYASKLKAAIARAARARPAI